MTYQMNLFLDSFTVSPRLVSLSEYKVRADFCALPLPDLEVEQDALLSRVTICPHPMLPPRGRRVLCSTIPNVYCSLFGVSGEGLQGTLWQEIEVSLILLKVLCMR